MKAASAGNACNGIGDGNVYENGRMQCSPSPAPAPSHHKTLVSGAVAGASAKSVVAPLDRVKLLFQVSREPFSLEAARRKTLTLVRTEGVRGLWKGNTAVVARVLPATAVNYAAYLEAKRRLHDAAPFFAANAWACNFSAGAAAGMLSTLVTHPLDVVRARLAVEPGRQTVGLVGMTGRIWMEHGGPRGLWVGITPALLGIVPYRSVSSMTTVHRMLLAPVTSFDC